jgi:large subunit ribosomal protein L23
MMKAPEDVILKPLITEKSNMEIAQGKYTFVVDTSATKVDIRKSVEKLFQVKVLNVHTINYEGKEKRMGAHVGRRSSWKKAIVKIDTNPKADIYLDKGGKQLSTGKKYKSTIEEFGNAQ